MNFIFHTPTQVVFGADTFKSTNEHVKNLGKKCLIVTGKKAMKKFGHLDKLKKILIEDNYKVEIYDNISNDAKSSEVNAASEICRKKNIDFIIGLGGGSSIDAAKAISVGFDIENIESLIGTNLKDEKKSIPLVAIPTTAGTGSEVTKGAIITDVNKNFKSGIRGKQIFPRIAIIDPLLSLTMPRDVAATTGFDAFTHLFESYLAKKSNYFTDMLSLEGLKIVLTKLPESLNKPNDLILRSQICFAALLGGINVGNASTCLPHRLQQAMGSVKEIHQPHARGLASLYPFWVNKVYKYRKQKIENLKKFLQNDEEGIEFIIKFMDKIKINNKLSDYNVKKDHIEIFIKNISGNIENDPIENKDEKLIKEIYSNSL